MSRTSHLPAIRRTSGAGVVVVALAAAALALAGTAPRGVGAAPPGSQRIQLEQRQFTCAGGIPQATAVHGTVTGGVARPTPVGDRPQQIDVDRAEALDAFAGQQSRTRDWLAWLPCPEPRARWWFVGAGAASVTHDTVLTVSNPRVGQADVDIDVYGPRGPVAAPGLHGLTVPAGETRTIDLAKVAPAVGDLAVHLVATRGLVAVSAADRFAPGIVGTSVQEWLPSQPTPGRSITLAGLPPNPGRAALLVVNPRQVETIVSVEVVGATGTFAPKQGAEVTVPPGSVESLPLASVLGGDAAAIRITSTRPVTAAVRTVSGGDVAFATGVRPIRGSTAFAVPRGAARLVLSSVGEETSVELTAHDAAGRPVLDRSVTVAKATSVATALPAATRYVRLVASSPDAVAGFSVTSPDGVATGGVLPSITSVLLPVVRPGW